MSQEKEIGIPMHGRIFLVVFAALFFKDFSAFFWLKRHITEKAADVLQRTSVRC